MRIALVCDFYYPSLGGVEIHIQSLARILTIRGHYVIVITHYYGEEQLGLKQIADGSKFYYLLSSYSKQMNVVYPTFFLGYFQAKQILISQKIQIVHCHQSASTLALQYGLYAKFLGLKVLHTQHSLFGFKSLFDIHLNKVISSIFCYYDRIITVSRTTRNNLILRTDLNPQKTVVIPNGVSIGDNFLDKSSNQFDDGFIHVVVLGRLAYRRGTDLLIQMLPEFCRRNHIVKIHFVGDGPKMGPLRSLVQRQKIKDQVQLLGSMSNPLALKFISQCHIFLNTPLTESFGIALVEAASLGLHCVSTNVGSIEEILPIQILTLVQPNKNSIINGLEINIKRILSMPSQNKRLSGLKFSYNWEDCVDRTVEVYEKVIQQPKITTKTLIIKILKRNDILGYFYLFLILLYLIVDTLSAALKRLKIQDKGVSKKNTDKL